MQRTPTILFLCTGNYYRSRFAEALFNHLAHASGLNMRAISRGLAIEPGVNNGAISPHTIKALEAHGIRLPEVIPEPCPLSYGDLQHASLIVALKEAEHRSILDRRFPGWSARTVFWHVHDLDGATPEVALSEIESHVRTLIRQLTQIDQTSSTR